MIRTLLAAPFIYIGLGIYATGCAIQFGLSRADCIIINLATVVRHVRNIK